MALARAVPGSLVLGVDPVAEAMAETSRRAAKSAFNAVFVAASAEELAGELPAIADDVVTYFPWGSLLRGFLGVDAAVGEAIAAVAKPGGRISALVSVTERDRVAAVADLEAVVAGRAGPSRRLELVDARLASRAEIHATRSTWGRRLLAGRPGDARPVWRLEWCRRER